jgi:hypothetical protein
LRACGVIDTACTIFASVLGEFEAEFKKALAHESGAQGVLFDEKKTEGRKSRDTVPLNKIRIRVHNCEKGSADPDPYQNITDAKNLKNN